MKRPSFVFTAEMERVVMSLEDDGQRLAILQAIAAYGLHKRKPCLTPLLSVLWDSAIVPELDRQWRLYQNGCKGGAPKGNKNACKKQPTNNQDGSLVDLKTTKKQPKNNQDTDVEVVAAEVVTADFEKQPNEEVVLCIFDDSEKEMSPQTPLKEKDITKKESNNFVITKERKSIEQRMADFRDTLVPYEAKYGADMLEAFFTYWSEPTIDGKKMRYELQKTWSVGGRLSTWYRNNFHGNTSFSTPLQRKAADDAAIDAQRATQMYNLMNRVNNDNGDNQTIPLV